MIKSGIYKITSKKTGKIYIGSSSNIVKRWRTHKYDLKNNRHHSQYLQRMYNKYGEDDFDYEIIEYCENYLEREKYYQELHNVFNPKIGLNLRKIDQLYISPYNLKKVRKGWNHTEESKIKMSKSKMGHNYLSKEHYDKLGMLFRGKIRNPEIAEKMKETLKKRRENDRNYKKHKKCYVYNNNFSFFKEFESVNDFEEFLKEQNPGIKRTSIYRAIKYQYSIYTYYVSFIKTEFYIPKNKFKEYNFIVQFDKFEDKIINFFPNASIAARQLFLKGSSGITACCLNKRNFCKETRWKYLRDINIEAYGSDAIRKLGEFKESLEVDNFKLS